MVRARFLWGDSLLSTLPLPLVYDRLFQAYGQQHWWPAESVFEVIVGAVLVQNTAWGNVEKAIAALKESRQLSPQAIYDLPGEELEQRIRPSGVFRVKAKRLKSLVALIIERYGGSLDDLFSQPTEELRDELLAVHGVGFETADAIVLYAAKQPAFVIDAYTRRVMTRHGWAAEDANYANLQQQFESALPRNVQLYNEYHALLVRVGKERCKKTPICQGCPLETLLP